MLRGASKPSGAAAGARDEPPRPGMIKDNYTEEMRRREDSREGGGGGGGKAKAAEIVEVDSDLHWIGGVPVDVRQAGTGGLPREGLHHGQQKEK